VKLLACLILLPLVSSAALGWEPYRVDPTQQAFSEEGQDLDHLEPVNGSLPENYYLIQFTYDVAMEYSTSNLEISRDEKSGKYLLLTWGEWKHEQSGEQPPRTMKLPVPVRMEIPEDIAATAYAMWVNALFEVRYDRRADLVLDGWSDTFSTYVRGKGWMHGYADVPTRELPPRWLEEAGKALLQLGKDKDVARCRKELAELHRKLFAYLEAHAKH
jgi:hypothetical protein